MITAKTPPTPNTHTDDEWCNLMAPPDPTLIIRTAPSQVVPILPQDQVSTTRLKVVTYSTEILQKTINFCNIEAIIGKIKQVAQPTIKIKDLGLDPVQDPGEMATIPKQ
eukprot:14665419-Ditylum_brightwellii.AAC.2